MIRTEKLTKDFGNGRGVFELDLSIPKGKIFGFIGPNGAGKTTTIKALCGLLKPTSGRAFINDIPVTPRNSRQIRRFIGYMPDTFGVYEQMSVWEYLDFFCAAYRIPRVKRRPRIDEVLELSEAAYMLDYRMGSLSHGMGKRVALARTLLHDPQVLIMDEPASGLDPYGRIEMRKMIQRLRDLGKTIMLSSHILPELSSVCDLVGIIEKGHLLSHGSVKEITTSLRKQMVLSIMIQSDINQAIKVCQANANVRKVSAAGNELRIIFAGTRGEIAALNTALTSDGVEVIGLTEEEGSLEEAFLQVTGQKGHETDGDGGSPADA